MLFKKKKPVSPNFLASYPFASPTEELGAGASMFFIFLLLIFLFPFQQFQILGFALLAFLFLLAVVIKIEWGIYALGLVCFFHGWEIAFVDYTFTRNISFLSAINAPLVDFIATLLMLCLGFAFVLKRVKMKMAFSHLVIPSFLYSAFLGIAFWSAHNAKLIDSSISTKFVERPLLFLFVSNILLPNFFIQNKIVLFRFLKLWFWVGVAIALFGLSSLFVVKGADWTRIQPYGFGSFAPLGVNHNLIAEVLVALVPIGLLLMWEEKSNKKIKGVETVTPENIDFTVYVIGTGLMLLVALGTLSRAAWLTLGVQMIALFFLFREQGKILYEKVKHLLVPVTVLSLIFFSYMAVFLTSNVVSSSDSARVEVTKMVYFYAQRSPLFGYGPGSFIPLLTDTYAHIIEFGDPLDAHGMIQKILIEEGGLGLVTFGLFLLSILLLVYKKQKQTKSVLLKLVFVMILGAMFFQIFNTSYFKSVLWMPLGIALAAVGVSDSKKETRESSESSSVL